VIVALEIVHHAIVLVHPLPGAIGFEAKPMIWPNLRTSSVACIRPWRRHQQPAHAFQMRRAEIPSSNLAAAVQCRDGSSVSVAMETDVERVEGGAVLAIRRRSPPRRRFLLQRQSLSAARSRRAASAAISPSSARRMNNRSRTSFSRYARDERAVLRLDVRPDDRTTGG
jgi:hypothetical protein